MDPNPEWQVWRNRLRRVKGIAIVFRASDYALELHAPLIESDKEAWCKELCDILNTTPRHAYIGQGRPVKTERAQERGWLVANGQISPSYRTMDEAGIHWTTDINKAIRFARRADAEMFAADDEDAWRIVEHMWVKP